MIGVTSLPVFLFAVIKTMTHLEIRKAYYNLRILFYELQHTVIIHKCCSFYLNLQLYPQVIHVTELFTGLDAELKNRIS